jgi:hypothetical protein
MHQHRSVQVKLVELGLYDVTGTRERASANPLELHIHSKNEGARERLKL